MSKVIATVKLAPGKVAFYDEYSKIHLTLSNPMAQVYDWMDLRRIKSSVKYGSLKVLSGSLTEPVITEVNVATPKISATIENTSKKEAIVVEEKITEVTPEAKADEDVSVVEPVETSEEIVEKKTTKRTKKAAKEVTEEESGKEQAEVTE